MVLFDNRLVYFNMINMHKEFFKISMNYNVAILKNSYLEIMCTFVVNC